MSVGNNGHRPSDWPTSLSRAIERRGETPFRWGRHDCVLAACNVVRDVFGVDPAARIRGYKTRRQAEALKRRWGGGEDLERALSALFSAQGISRIHYAFAAGGDLVLVETGKGPALAVLAGDGVPFAAGRVGWAKLERTEVRAAWRVV